MLDRHFLTVSFVRVRMAAGDGPGMTPAAARGCVHMCGLPFAGDQEDRQPDEADYGYLGTN